MRRIHLLILLSLILLVFSTSLSFAQESEPKLPQKEQLQTLLETELKARKQQQKRLSEIENSLSTMSKSVEEKVQTLMPYLSNLYMLRGFAEDDFRRLMVLKQNLEQLRKELQSQVMSLDYFETELTEIENELKDKKQELEEQEEFIPEDGQKSIADKEETLISEMLRKIDRLQKKLEVVQEPVDKFEKRMEKLETNIQSMLIVSLKNYFFRPSESLINFAFSRWWKQLGKWKENISVYYNYFLLGQLRWKLFIAHLVLFFAFSFLVLFFFLAWLEKKVTQLTLRDFIYSIIPLSLGGSIYGVYNLFQGHLQSLMIITAGQLLFSSGIILILNAVRNMVWDIKQVDTKLRWKFWGLFAVALILQILSLPEAIASFFWILWLVFLIINFKRALKFIQISYERILVSVSIGLMVILIFLALGGLIYLSLLVATCWFVVCIGLMIARITNYLLNKKVASFPESNWGYLAQGVIQGTGVPTIWLVAISTVFIWLGANLGDLVILKKLFTAQLSWGKISVNLFRIGVVVILFYLARSGSLILKSLLGTAQKPAGRLDLATIITLQTLVSYVVWGLYIIIILAVFKFSLTSLTVVAGGLSVGIGFGLQSIVSNFISGLILLFGRSIRPGDIIQVDDIWAEVKQINFRTTEVETYDMSSLLLPNSQLIGERITNWTHKNKTLRREITVGVSYDSDTKMVERLLRYAADTHPDILKFPSPYVRFWDFGDNSLIFSLYFYAIIDVAWKAESKLRHEIKEIFKEYNVNIALPQRDLHIKTFKGLEQYLKEKTPSEDNILEEDKKKENKDTKDKELSDPTK